MRISVSELYYISGTGAVDVAVFENDELISFETILLCWRNRGFENFSRF